MTDVHVGPVAIDIVPFVYCKNLPVLVTDLLSRRDMNDFHIRIGIDGGGSLKVILVISLLVIYLL